MRLRYFCSAASLLTTKRDVCFLGFFQQEKPPEKQEETAQPKATEEKKEEEPKPGEGGVQLVSADWLAECWSSP